MRLFLVGVALFYVLAASSCCIAKMFDDRGGNQNGDPINVGNP